MKVSPQFLITNQSTDVDNAAELTQLVQQML
jgi:heat shock factor-binding protein 1